MKAYYELRKIASGLDGLNGLPPDEAAKMFLERWGDLDGQDISIIMDILNKRKEEYNSHIAALLRLLKCYKSELETRERPN